MKTVKNNWATLAGALGVGGLIIMVMWLCATAWGQSLPGLSIALTGTNQLSLVVTNGVTNTQYQIYRTLTLNETQWTLVTNGTVGQTNFTYNFGDEEWGFFKAENNTNFAPVVITVIIQTPANGSVIY